MAMGSERFFLLTKLLFTSRREKIEVQIFQTRSLFLASRSCACPSQLANLFLLRDFSSLLRALIYALLRIARSKHVRI